MPCQLHLGAIPGTGLHLSWASYKAQFSLGMVQKELFGYRWSKNSRGKYSREDCFLGMDCDQERDVGTLYQKKSPKNAWYITRGAQQVSGAVEEHLWDSPGLPQGGGAGQ